MKLLFDENLSPKLVHLLAGPFPGGAHVRDCGLRGFSDESVWGYARDNGFTIVSKDADFSAAQFALWGIRQELFGCASGMHPGATRRTHHEPAASHPCA